MSRKSVVFANYQIARQLVDKIKNTWQNIDSRIDITAEDKANFRQHEWNKTIKDIENRRVQMESAAYEIKQGTEQALTEARQVDEAAIFKKASTLMPLLANSSDEELLLAYKNQFDDAVTRRIIEQTIGHKVMSTSDPENSTLFTKFKRLDRELEQYLPESERTATQEDRKARALVEYCEIANQVLKLESMRVEKELNGADTTIDHKVKVKRLESKMEELEKLATSQ